MNFVSHMIDNGEAQEEDVYSINNNLFSEYITVRTANCIRCISCVQPVISFHSTSRRSMRPFG